MTSTPMSLLLIEDSPADARYVMELLPKSQYVLTHAASLTEAAEQMSTLSFNLVLLDLSLPESVGLDTFRTIHSALPATPIIILTGLDDEDISLQAVKLGAQDYILKREMSEFILSRAIKYACERKTFDQNSKRLAILEQHEEFMATLTHDLKNPLIGANRLLELMAAKALGAVSDEQADILLQLRDSNKLLLSMIQNLIEVYRFERDVDDVKLEQISLLKIIDTCIHEIAPIANNRDITLKTEFSENTQNVLADKMALRRVVQNLLDNALKFTPNGGNIVLSATNENGTVSFAVQDSGPGIPLDEQARLFERFSQGRVGKKYTPGTGLGLFLCKKLVDAHRGKIACFSEEGSGTKFTVKIPAA